MYEGEYVSDAPRLVVDPESGFEISHTITDEVVTTTDGWIANHRQTGIFAAHGPAVREGKQIDGLDIYDIRPLIETLFDVPTAKTDGKAPSEVRE
jgi:predicted AlkP superfamily phosphohydrolase/phosphomutase